jgi:IclR family acetate operon transcriptional repressor
MSLQEKNPNRREKHIFTGRSTADSTSLRRATNILNCLSNDVNTITDVAAYLGYSTSTVHRLLQNLNALGWVVQEENNHKYYIGPMITHLSSNQIASHKYLIMHAIHEMNHLSEITGETITIVTMVQLRHVLLHEIPSTYSLKITQESKMTSPSYAGAVAKMLLAQLGDKELNATLKHIKNDQIDVKTEINPELMMSQLKAISGQGYCVTCGERTPGSLCISAAIKNYFCPTTLNILGLENRLRPNLNQYIKELQASTSRISKDIADAFDNKGGD